MTKSGTKHSGWGMSRFGWFLHLRRFLLAQPGYTFGDSRGSAYRSSGVFNIGDFYVNSAGYQVDQMVKEGLIYCNRNRGGTYSITLSKKGKAFHPTKDIFNTAAWMMEVKAAREAGITPPPRPTGYFSHGDAEALIGKWLADDEAVDVGRGIKPAIAPLDDKLAPPMVEVTTGTSEGVVDVRLAPDPLFHADPEAVAAAIVEQVISRATGPIQGKTFDEASLVAKARDAELEAARLRNDIAKMRERAELAERNLQTLIDNLANEKAETELAHVVTPNGTATPLLDRLSESSRDELAKLMKQVPVGPG
jgi:hypothetical protein